MSLKRLEQLEYERLDDELAPVVLDKLRSVPPVLAPGQARLILLAVLLKQATRIAQMLGMTEQEFMKRAANVADKAFKPRSTIVAPP